MREFNSVAELAALAGGEEIGQSPYILVDQEKIDTFADATGDHQWIHVNVARAKTEMPGGKTIAHGYLTLSLIPQMAAAIYQMKGDQKVLNYGLNRVRFTGPVSVDSELRLRLSVVSAKEVATGVRVTMSNHVEVKGQDRPVVIAENIIFFPR